MAKCGAKSKRSGKPCKNNAMANGRCRMHGGKTPKGSKNALKHGIYAEGFTDDEIEFLGKVTLGNIDQELNVLRVQLRRANICAREVAERPNDPNAGFRLSEVDQRDETSRQGRKTSRKVKRSRPDFISIIERLTTRIANLEMVRVQLLNAGASDDPAETARKIREALDEMDRLTGGIDDDN